MCKASVEALLTRDAKQGDVTRLGFSPHGFPQFERPQDEATGTVTCALTGQKIQFDQIPEAVQQKYDLPPSFAAAFVEDVGDVPDKIFLGDGRLIDLGELVWEEGVQEDVIVTMLDVMTADERQRMLDSIAGRSNPKVVNDDRLPVFCIGH